MKRLSVVLIDIFNLCVTTTVLLSFLYLFWINKIQNDEVREQFELALVGILIVGSIVSGLAIGQQVTPMWSANESSARPPRF